MAKSSVKKVRECEHTDCRQYDTEMKMCDALDDTEFKDKKGYYKACPFYKPRKKKG